MAYACKACGAKMKKASSMGTCIACGSPNVTTYKTSVAIKQEKPTKSKIEIAIMILLWSLLIYGVYDRFFA